MKNSIGYIILTVIFKPEEGVWTAECKELGTATFGDTLEEARLNLKEAIELHLNTLEKVGERESFFAENGVQIYTDQPSFMSFPELPFDPNILVSKNIETVNMGHNWA
jgi:predicted RNase H-like HicB family nuclease